jgi:hypothetical protein
MLKTELTDAHKKFKNPERRINAIYTNIIISVLWGALVFVVYNWGKNLLEDNRKKDEKIELLTRKNQDLNNKNYQFILDQLQKVRNFQNYQDSVNNELIKIKNILTSK